MLFSLFLSFFLIIMLYVYLRMRISKHFCSPSPPLSFPYYSFPYPKPPPISFLLFSPYVVQFLSGRCLMSQGKLGRMMPRYIWEVRSRSCLDANDNWGAKQGTQDGLTEEGPKCALDPASMQLRTTEEPSQERGPGWLWKGILYRPSESAMLGPPL